MQAKKHYHRVLTIAGSDSGGGAGIQADLKTISANRCYGMSVITALTAQNTLGVTAIHAVPVDFVAAQMDAVLSDIGADAVKIGMLFSPELIRTVADGLRRHGAKNIVLDPVMVAQSGDKLLGRARFGWRGRNAVRVLYAGSALLLLAYVGSRFVLEVVLGRSA